MSSGHTAIRSCGWPFGAVDAGWDVGLTFFEGHGQGRCGHEDQSQDARVRERLHDGDSRRAALMLVAALVVEIAGE